MKGYAYDWLGNAKFYIVIIMIVCKVMIFKRLVNVWQFMEYPTIVDQVLKEWRQSTRHAAALSPSGSRIESEIEIPYSISEEVPIQGVVNIVHQMGKRNN